MADWDEIRKLYRPMGAGGSGDFPEDNIESLITDKKEKAFRNKVMGNSKANAEELLDKLESSAKNADILDFPSRKVADDGTAILDTLKNVDVDESALPNPTKYEDQLMKAVREDKRTGMPNVDARISDTAGRSRMALPMEMDQISKAKVDPSGTRMATSRERDKIKALANMKNKLENRPLGTRMANSGEKNLLDSLKGSRMGSPKEMSFMKKLGKKLPGAAGLAAMLALSPDDASASDFIPGLDMADSAGMPKEKEDMMMAEIQAKKNYDRSQASFDKMKKSGLSDDRANRAISGKMDRMLKEKRMDRDARREDIMNYDPSTDETLLKAKQVGEDLDSKFIELPIEERERLAKKNLLKKMSMKSYIDKIKRDRGLK